MGVCYYPEHWPEQNWADDAHRMVQSGLSWVRVGEFAWSKLEPYPGDLRLEWLDRALDTLGQAGLRVVLGTPTATPPRWMLERHPDMLAHDDQGRPRGFGSRRHYCFSHGGYRSECVRIAEILGERYGFHPHVAAWQIDNEYGCHDTTTSYSAAALAAFRHWLADRYECVERLNAAWGNVFWSMEYQRFDQIELPYLTVTEPNPAHVLAFRRFSSDQVVAFNKAQADVLRRLTQAPLLHNYMGRILDFDHFEVGSDLDIATWDSYPIGFLSDRLEVDDGHKSAFLRQGDPDLQAFHHDLYRSVGNGRWWLMEQQPGPVNWAPFNPKPLPGMVRLWSLEAVAHGAEVVSYFRWRQAPFGQEQMHSGLMTPLNMPTQALEEVKHVSDDLRTLGDVQQSRSEVAILFDYVSHWAWTAQPHGDGFNYFRLVFSTYRALRRAGLSVDILPASSRNFDGYKLLFAPGLAVVDSDLDTALREFEGVAVLGPRAGAITEEFQLPPRGRPSFANADFHVSQIETVPETEASPVNGGGQLILWVEYLDGDYEALLSLENGLPAMVATDDFWYLAGMPDDDLWDRVVKLAAGKTEVALCPMSRGVRRRKAGQDMFVFNYNSKDAEYKGRRIEPCGVLCFRNGVWLPLRG